MPDFESVAGEDSELEEDLQEEEDFRLIGVELQAVLSAGEEISDDLYVRLFLAKVRMTYPHKAKQSLKSDLRDKVVKENQLLAAIQKLEDDLDPNNEGTSRRRKRNMPQMLEEKKKLEEELEEFSQVPRNGWVIVDFPANFAQGKLLENSISGFMPGSECDPINRDN